MDWQEAYALLHVVEKAHGYPQLHPLRDEAMKKLQEHADILRLGKPQQQSVSEFAATEPDEPTRRRV